MLLAEEELCWIIHLSYQEYWLHHLLWNHWTLKFFTCHMNSSVCAQNVVSQRNWKRICPVTVKMVLILVKWRFHLVAYEKIWFQLWKHGTITYQELFFEWRAFSWVTWGAYHIFMCRERFKEPWKKEGRNKQP